jgi:DNA-directed RNA polymerase alpha subunit
MPTYQVKAGYHFGSHRQLRAGDVVELEEEEALAFLDKLELATETGGRELVTSAPDQFATEADDLPEGFPLREKLIAAGFFTLTAVLVASDEELLAVKGIGAASLKEIREAL